MPKQAGNWIMGELARVLRETDGNIAKIPLSPERLAGLIRLVDSGSINGSTAKEVFEKMFTSNLTADEIVRVEGLTQIDDAAAIQTWVDEVMSKHPDAVSQYHARKTSALGFLVGQVMKGAKGKANPKRVNEVLRRMLDQASGAQRM